MAKWTKVADKKEFVAGKALTVDVDGNKIAVFNVGGNYFAIDDTCTHAGGSLSEGPVEGTVVVCPWHGASFDLKSGQVVDAPATEAVRTYQVMVDGDDVKVETP